MRIKLLAGAAALVLAAGFVPALPCSVPGAGVALAQTKGGSQGMVTRTGSGRMSLDVQGADIRTVLRSISEFSGRNIVAGKDVKGNISVSLKDVRWQDALTAVCRTQSLDYVEEGGILRVDTAEKLQSETLARETNDARREEVAPLATKVVKVGYANATELRPAVQSVLSKRGSVEVDTRTNSLIITDLEERLTGAQAMAQELDTRTPQIEIMAKLVDIDVAALRELGVTWGVTNLDLKNISNPTDPLQPQLGVEAPATDRVGSIAGILTRPWGTVEFLLEALEEKRQAQIISNPRITTVDNREARILVGQKIPLIVQDVAGNAVSQLQTIGIQLKVTPHMTADNKIMLDMKPEVSDLASQSTVQGGVIINTSEADTRVLVDDGQTAVIGGLIRTNEGTVVKGVPILMDIPFLGGLFRNKTTAKQQRELVIFVTPKLLDTVADATPPSDR